MNFKTLLNKKWQEEKFVCVGLDSDLAKIPLNLSILEFNKKIIDATIDIACAFKPNSAFYESQGSEGIKALIRTVSYIKRKNPSLPVILDFKRGDIGSTNEGYAKFAFDIVGADAITVHPYLGKESLEPLLGRKDKGIFVLVKTSNPGAGEFQDLLIKNKPLYLHVSESVSKKWNSNKNCGLVVGATYPKELKKVRDSAPDLPFLIPGIGKQGGDLEKVIKYGANSEKKGFIINSSRDIIFASQKKDFAKKAREKTEELNSLINQFIK